ncbi:Cystinosin-like protein, partial [Bienertia sinuspersici]
KRKIIKGQKKKKKKKNNGRWNSIQLKVLYEVFGWVAFVAWSISFYPQVIMNFRRKSVVGLNLDFVVLNLTKHSSYLIYNVVLYFSATAQAHIATSMGLPRYSSLSSRETQRFSKVALVIICAVWLSAAVCVFVAIHRHSWLWLISVFNTIQVTMTVIKYVPQAIMNFRLKSTDGFSIGNILLDLLGGVTNYGQMAMQSIDQILFLTESWVNFYGNIGKTLLSLVSIFFDILFIIQHYVLYPARKRQQLPVQTSRN